MTTTPVTTTRTATIAESESLSDAQEMSGSALVGIVMPAAWTAAGLTFQASHDGVTYNNLYDENGNEITLTVSTSRYVKLAAQDFAGMNFLKVRSGTSGSAVAQAAEREIELVVLKL